MLHYAVIFFISIFKVKTTSFSWLALAFKISLKKLESYL